jgi:hypothetical protein
MSIRELTDALKRALLAAKSVAYSDSAREYLDRNVRTPRHRP